MKKHIDFKKIFSDILKRKKLCFIIFYCLLTFILSCMALGITTLSTVALEQEARCGMEEHVHTDSCYKNDILVCNKKEHMHSRNCYIVLMNDNDINNLIVETDNDKKNNLENLITDVIKSASGKAKSTNLVFQRGLLKQSAAPMVLNTAAVPVEDKEISIPVKTKKSNIVLTEDSVAEMNREIKKDKTIPPVTLNENINKEQYVMANYSEKNERKQGSTYSIGDQPQTADYYANYYINLDGNWVCIGSIECTAGNRRMRVNNTDQLNFINNSLNTNWSYSNFDIYISDSENGSFSLLDINPDKTYTQVRSTRRDYSPVYMRIVGPGEDLQNNSLLFNSVTYNYLDGRSEKVYVEKGTEVQIPVGQKWTDQKGKNYNSGDRVIINEKTTFTEKNKDSGGGGGGDDTVVIEKPVLKDGSYVNVMCYIDGKWRNIGSLNYSKTWFTKPIYISKTNLDNLLKNNLDSTPSYDVYHSESIDTGYQKATVSGNDINVGERGFLDTREAYVRIVSPGDNVSTNKLKYNSVNFIYLDGTKTTKYIPTGEQVTLPTKGEWLDDNGTRYIGGSVVTINTKTNFKEVPPVVSKNIEVKYNVNFPVVDGITYVPATINGNNTYNETIYENEICVIKNVSDDNVEGLVNGAGNKMARMAHFAGWKVQGTEVILAPDSAISWQRLTEYSKDNKVTLEGVWEYQSHHTVNFFIKYDSVAVQGGSIEKYTNKLFATYVGGDSNNQNLGITTPGPVENATKEEIYQVDKNIRLLEGRKPEGVWMLDFPRDKDVFLELQKYHDKLLVDNIPVHTSELNENGYAIRWYIFKLQGDGWHVDGKLVRKYGKSYITKAFAGNKKGIADAKKNFYIEAKSNEGRNLVLDLNNYTEYDSSTDTYRWLINDVIYNEQWTVTEKNYNLNDLYTVHTTYNIVDPLGTQSMKGTGPTANVLGATFAIDIGQDEYLSLDFTNIYRAKDSFIIKKEDFDTNKPIAGAGFELWQQGQLLKFRYDSAENNYIYDANGTITELTGKESGYIEIISIKGISFDNGPMTIKETTVPAGYDKGEDSVLERVNNVVTLTSGAQSTYEDGVLFVGNVSHKISVNVRKEWNCLEEAKRDVVIKLLANGHLVTGIFPNVPAIVTLNKANNYNYIWQDVPEFADGKKVEYSIKEIKIGDEEIRNDDTFASWDVFYDYPTAVEGTVFLKVTNEPHQVHLTINKTDMYKKVFLPGAVFTLSLLDDQGNVVKIYPEGTTGADGTLRYDNLYYGRYCLNEISAPDFYVSINEPIYFTINTDNTITIENNYYAEKGKGAFDIIVKNPPAVPLPESGGEGIYGYILGGMILIILSLLALFKKSIL